jgi:hypothetical protein
MPTPQELAVERLEKVIRLEAFALKLISEIHMDINTVKQQVNALLTVAIPALEQKVADNKAADDAAIGLLQAQSAAIADLQARLAGGAAVTAADLQALSDATTAVATRLTAAADALGAANAAETAAVTAATPTP